MKCLCTHEANCHYAVEYDADTRDFTDLYGCSVMDCQCDSFEPANELDDTGANR